MANDWKHSCGSILVSVEIKRKESNNNKKMNSNLNLLNIWTFKEYEKRKVKRRKATKKQSMKSFLFY